MYDDFISYIAGYVSSQQITEKLINHYNDIKQKFSNKPVYVETGWPYRQVVTTNTYLNLNNMDFQSSIINATNYMLQARSIPYFIFESFSPEQSIQKTDYRVTINNPAFNISPFSITVGTMEKVQQSLNKLNKDTNGQFDGKTGLMFLLKYTPKTNLVNQYWKKSTRE
jgi:hypothetical protein